MSAENKALTRRLDEQVGNEGNLDIIDEIRAPDFVAHVGGAPAALRGSAAVKDWAALWRTAFPDVHATVEDVIAEHDKVVTRITLTGTHQGPLIPNPPTSFLLFVIDLGDCWPWRWRVGWAGLPGVSTSVLGLATVGCWAGSGDRGDHCSPGVFPPPASGQVQREPSGRGGDPGRQVDQLVADGGRSGGGVERRG